MADETKTEETIPTWGYKDGEAQIFNLKKGEKLPAGWKDTPAADKPASDKPKG